MTRNTLISPWQGAAMLILFRVFHLLTLSPAGGEAQNATDALLALPLSYLVLAVLMLPAYFFVRRFGGITGGAGAFAGRAAAVLLCGFSLLAAAFTVGGFQALLTSAAYPKVSPAFFIVTFAAVCAYAAFLGLEPIARMGSVIFVAFLAVTVFISAAVLPKASFVYLQAPMQGGGVAFLKLVLSGAFANFDVVIWLLLAPNIKGGALKSFAIWAVGALAALEYLILLLAVGLGDFAGTQEYPFYSLAASGEISVFQRLDSLHITLWTFIAFVKASVYLYFASHCMGLIIPRAKKWERAALCGGAAAVAALLAAFSAGGTAFLKSALQGGVPVAALAVALPLLLLLTAALKKRGGRAK